MLPIDVTVKGGPHGSTFSAFEQQHPLGWPGGLFVDSI